MSWRSNLFHLIVGKAGCDLTERRAGALFGRVSGLSNMDESGNALVFFQPEGSVEGTLERHLSTAQEWFPHEYIPWEQGRSFTEQPWELGDSRLSGVEVSLRMPATFCRTTTRSRASTASG